MSKLIFEPENHEYFYNGKKVPCVSNILEEFGISDFSKVNPRVLERACLFGSNVHETCELYDKDDLASCDPAIQPYLDQWKKFREDYNFLEFDLIEKPLYSKVWGFAGTLDRLSKGFGGLLDIKSGQEYVSHKIQTALYEILAKENGYKVKKRGCVYLKPGKYKFVWNNDKTDLSIAKSLISIYNFKKKEKLL